MITSKRCLVTNSHRGIDCLFSFRVFIKSIYTAKIVGIRVTFIGKSYLPIFVSDKMEINIVSVRPQVRVRNECYQPFALQLEVTSVIYHFRP